MRFPYFTSGQACTLQQQQEYVRILYSYTEQTIEILYCSSLQQRTLTILGKTAQQTCVSTTSVADKRYFRIALISMQNNARVIVLS